MFEGEALKLALIGVLLLMSAFFSSAEAAFLSLERTRMAHLVSSGVPGAARIDRMIGNPERLLSTILLGNNLVNVAFAALVTLLVASALGEGKEGQTAAIATGIGTVLLLIAGETIPKSIAVRRAERVAFLYSLPVVWFEAMAWPVVVVLQWLAHRVSSLLGGGEIRALVTEGEIRTVIDMGQAQGAVGASEAEMLGNVFRFGDMEVREVMTPRTEMVSVARGALLSDVLVAYAEHAHTRLPVYRGSVDNVIGIISAKDVLKVISTGEISLDDSVTDIIRDAYFVPETKRAAELFDELRRTGNQIAIAVDEYGVVAGLVTLRGLSEKVVGPVGEEGAGPEEEYEAIDRNTFQVDGGMSIDEVNEELGVALPEGDFETIAGFALAVLGYIPTGGEQFEYANLKLEITEMNDLKIETIKVTKLPVA
ncbi:MAG: hemolysin family protein [Chloroflexi bacterium]|nr:hemolysin family protein [Chloroflexota bacterium]